MSSEELDCNFKAKQKIEAATFHMKSFTHFMQCPVFQKLQYASQPMLGA